MHLPLFFKSRRLVCIHRIRRECFIGSLEARDERVVLWALGLLLRYEDLLPVLLVPVRALGRALALPQKDLHGYKDTMGMAGVIPFWPAFATFLFLIVTLGEQHLIAIQLKSVFSRTLCRP